jgi:hypothetical protein
VKLTRKGVDIDEYGMTTVDLKELDFRDEPFILAKDITQIFYVHGMSSNPRRTSLEINQQRTSQMEMSQSII